MALTFIMIVGTAGAGKSTLARELAEEYGAIILSSDAIRLELYGNAECQDDPAKVFEIMNARTQAFLRSGTSVIYDATNLLAKRRHEMVLSLPCGVRKECWVVHPTMRVTLRQNKHRSRQVPEAVIYRQRRMFQPPTKGEGWDVIKYRSPTDHR